MPEQALQLRVSLGRILLGMLVIPLALAATVRADDDDDGGGQGARQFDLIVSGYFEGRGKAIAKPNGTVLIQAQVEGPDGSAHLSMPSIPAQLRTIDGALCGSFSGSSTVNGKEFTVAGKIEPPDDDSETRLTVTYVFDGEHAGRMVGAMKGSKKKK